MNQNWKKFLSSKNAHFTEKGDITFPSDNHLSSNTLHPINHLSVITVSGSDAAKFLQGQLTCNIDEISENNAGIGAYCTAKGRTISTILLVKHKQSFLLILPDELLDKVKNKLQPYIMRDDVQMTDSRESLCLFGLASQNPGDSNLNLPDQVFSSTENNAVLWFKLPSQQSRFMAIGDTENAINCWTELSHKTQYQPASSNAWKAQDMLSGIPWLTPETSEQYVPQMLNLDQLQGISFNKGCYVGQEIVARTHYLGKTKRIMFLAECDSNKFIPVGSDIISENDSGQQSTGKVLSCLEHDNKTYLLIVMQTSSADSTNINLKTANGDKIALLNLTYSL